MSGQESDPAANSPGRPTDRYPKLGSDDRDGTDFSGDRTPLATADGDPGFSEEMTGEGDRADSAARPERRRRDTDPIVLPPEELGPRKTRRYGKVADEEEYAAAGATDPVHPELDATPEPPEDATPIGELAASQLAAGDDTPPGYGAEDHAADTMPAPVDARADTPTSETPVVDLHDEETPADGGDMDATDAAPVPMGAVSGGVRTGDPLLGRVIGGLVLEENIGRGGMGAIYRARHPHLRRDFAIKILPERLAQLPPFVERFINEARAAGRITHPGAVRVNSAGIEDGHHFIVMELVKGRDLRRIVEHRGQMHEFEVQRIAIEVSRVLAAAHTVGIIHRDIKPENLLLEDGNHRVRVTDFGLSMDTSADLAAVEASIGTPNYMSPEQCRGLGCDERSDIYALGATCYFLLTRRAPFQGHTPTAIMIQHVAEPPPDPRVYAPRTTDAFATLVMRMMAKAPEDRFASAGDLTEALTELRTSQEESPSPEAGIEVAERRGKASLIGILQEARKVEAEAIHVECSDRSCDLRLRIEGELRPWRRLSDSEGRELTQGIRAQAGLFEMPAAEPPTSGAEVVTPRPWGSHRHGRFEVRDAEGGRLPVFVGIVPGVTSERYVLRMLPAVDRYPLAPEAIDLSEEHRKHFMDWVARSRGVLVGASAPDGGITQLLNAFVAEVRRRPVAVTTLETTIEVVFEGVTQIELAPQHGLAQAEAFRAAIEQDSDVCVIHELQHDLWPDVFAAARAGRLLAVGVDLPDGIAVLRRMHERGISADDILELGLGVVSTRRLPRGCPDCLAPLQLRAEEARQLGLDASAAPHTVPTPTGCESCHELGTQGKETVRELLLPNAELLRALTGGATDDELRHQAADAGLMVPLRSILRERVLSGRTRVNDALRALEELA